MQTWQVFSWQVFSIYLSKCFDEFFDFGPEVAGPLTTHLIFMCK